MTRPDSGPCPVCGAERERGEWHTCQPTAENALAHIERANALITDLNNKRRDWVLRVPVDDDDPDVVLANALMVLREYVEATRPAGREEEQDDDVS